MKKKMPGPLLLKKPFMPSNGMPPFGSFPEAAWSYKLTKSAKQIESPWTSFSLPFSVTVQGKVTIHGLGLPGLPGLPGLRGSGAPKTLKCKWTGKMKWSGFQKAKKFIFQMSILPILWIANVMM